MTMNMCAWLALQANSMTQFDLKLPMQFTKIFFRIPGIEPRNFRTMYNFLYIVRKFRGFIPRLRKKYSMFTELTSLVLVNGGLFMLTNDIIAYFVKLKLHMYLQQQNLVYCTLYRSQRNFN